MAATIQVFSLQEDTRAGAARPAARLRVSPPQLPGQVRGGREGQRRAAPHRSRVGREGAGGGRARRGQGVGRAGAGPASSSLDKTPASLQRTTGSFSGRELPARGSGQAESATRPGGGAGRGGERRPRWPRRQPRTQPAAQGGRAASRSPPGAPAHGGRGAAVAALPVGGAPAAARRRLQLGHPRGQCDRENRGLREPLRLLAGHALAAAARGQAAVSSPILPTPSGRRPASEPGRGRAAFPPAGPASPGTPPTPGRSGARRPARSPPAPPGAAPPPHSAPEGGESGGRPLRTAAPVPGGAVLGPGRVYFFFFKQSVFRLSFPLGVCWEPGRWHALLSFTCVLGGGDVGWRVAVRCGEVTGRVVQGDPGLSQTHREHRGPPQTRAPRTSWKATFHHVLRGFPRRAGAPVGETFTCLSPFQKDGANHAPVRRLDQLRKQDPLSGVADPSPKPQSVRRHPRPSGPLHWAGPAEG